ncbi:MAG: type I methionyl aminopeptidase [Alphaproteobacteria bacterium]|nr:type I methionyl aminopeptidase [Alphaproteobacteria bacterium]MBE8220250.1 type I methionyl aminopeptidase [Alphaproteobacteria bacterium]
MTDIKTPALSTATPHEADADIFRTGAIKIHTPADFEAMRCVGQKAASVLDALQEFVQPGITTAALDDKAFTLIRDLGAVPAPLFYRGFPRSICTSVNHVVCHGIPSDKILREGDLLNIDVTLIYEGWHGDTSRMYALGDMSVKAQRLATATYDSMMRGIEAVRPGAHLGDIGAAIQAHAEANKISVVRDFCGHGLGRVFHDEPNVLHYGRAGQGVILKEGMFFTIEPMLNLGRDAVKVLRDGWTAVTRDRTLSAQYEHSIGVTADGAEIFTRSPSGLDQPHLSP